jgi:glycosyltransferase involved in cell wall biosynthesis
MPLSEHSAGGRFDGRGLFFWQRAPRTSSTSAPRRYRIANLVELLAGSTVVLRSRPDPGLFRGARAIVCLRPALDRWTVELVERCRAAGALLIADFDDLLFAGDVNQWPDVIAGHLSVADAERNRARYRNALGLFDAFTVSTRVLAEEIVTASGGARVAVVPNGVSRSWVWQGRTLYPSVHADAARSEAPRVIRYLPGSRHDHDLAVAAEPLGRCLRRHPDLRLEILGPCERLPPALRQASTRRLPRVPFDHLPAFLASSWLTLAPLADNAFNRAKSAVKFLESAAFGAPCIATSSAAVDARPRRPWGNAESRHRFPRVTVA